jgi:hypothetical protein
LSRGFGEKEGGGETFLKKVSPPYPHFKKLMKKGMEMGFERFCSV